jgi:hypothetical protein
MERAKINLISSLRQKGFESEADSILEILDSREARIKELEDKLTESFKRYDTMSKALDHFVKTELSHYTETKSAFPDGDFLGHKMYHEKLIKAAEAQTEFYLSLRNEIIKKGAWFAILTLLGIIWVGFRFKITDLFR